MFYLHLRLVVIELNKIEVETRDQVSSERWSKEFPRSKEKHRFILLLKR